MTGYTYENGKWTVVIDRSDFQPYHIKNNLTGIVEFKVSSQRSAEKLVDLYHASDVADETTTQEEKVIPKKLTASNWRSTLN